MFMTEKPLPSMTPQGDAESSTANAPRRLQSAMLLGKRGELVIVHKGRDYRLRLTQNGKLILTA